MKRWLVEVRLKDWHPGVIGGRIVSFEEVLADDEYNARHAAFSQFERKCKFEPATKLKMQQKGIGPFDCCAPDAVEIDMK